MPKIIVYLAEQERNAPRDFAQREMRVPRAQAAPSSARNYAITEPEEQGDGHD